MACGMDVRISFIIPEESLPTIPKAMAKILLRLLKEVVQKVHF